MPDTLFILNGPNLNLLGSREPEIYGATTLAEIEIACRQAGEKAGFAVDFRQTNSEGTLVDWVHEAHDKAAGIIVNPGAYSHTSVALLDAVVGVGVPTVEVHISNIFARERFRRHSYISPVVSGVISGFGPAGYQLAVDAISRIIRS